MSASTQAHHVQCILDVTFRANASLPSLVHKLSLLDSETHESQTPSRFSVTQRRLAEAVCVCVCVCVICPVEPAGRCLKVDTPPSSPRSCSWTPSLPGLLPASPWKLWLGEQEEEISPDMAPCCPLVLTSEIATQTQDLGAFPGHGFWFIAGSSLVGQE
jgi:hypothetical protein